MRVPRFVIPLLALTFAIPAVLMATSPAAAQGAQSDYPSGNGFVANLPAPEGAPSPAIIPYSAPSEPWLAGLESLARGFTRWLYDTKSGLLSAHRPTRTRGVCEMQPGRMQRQPYASVGR